MSIIDTSLQCDQCGEKGHTISSPDGNYCSLQCATDDIGRLCADLVISLEGKKRTELEEQIYRVCDDRMHVGSRSEEY